MNWPSLKQHRCPACGDGIKSRGLIASQFYCTSVTCDFKISEEKFEEVLIKMDKPKSKKEIAFEDSMAEFNNLNHNEIAEDFSDSPTLNK